MPTYPSRFSSSRPEVYRETGFTLSFFRYGSLSILYKETFQNTSNYPTLQEALAEYSDAVAFYDHISRYDESELVGMREDDPQINIEVTCVLAWPPSVCGMVAASSFARSSALLLLSSVA